MSEIVITPNFEKKTARIKGIAAAGEHVSVRIVGASKLDNSDLRLRVMFFKKTLAIFPFEDGVDAWGIDGEDLVCTLNMNTTQALKSFRSAMEAEVLLVLDNPVSRTLYFVDLCVMREWPHEAGTDAPIDLDGYVDFVADINSRMTAVESTVGEAESAIANEVSARMSADETHASEISRLSSEVKTKADSSALETLATKTEVDTAVDALSDAVSHAEQHITNHALDEDRHAKSEEVIRAKIAEALAGKEYNLSTNDGFVNAVIDIIQSFGGLVHE